MSIGVIVIGRNEGTRLVASLSSLRCTDFPVIYVDSGSSDDSVAIARSNGCNVLELDPSRPFTAARARNAGFFELMRQYPAVCFVQFLDGDCELVDGWLQTAEEFLKKNPHAAMVCGRLRERYPEHSVYNLLCDIEWDTPVGEAKACGGVAMARVDAFEQVNGFLPGLIAGEEPELCVRLRKAGWKIWRLGVEMGWHDAAMTRFEQWWIRSTRSGYGYAEGMQLHGGLPEKHWVAESHRAWIWGLGIPAGIIAAIITWGWGGVILLVIYPIQVMRLALKGKRSARENWARALFLTLGKFPEALGQVKFYLRKVGAGGTALIEYK